MQSSTYIVVCPECSFRFRSSPVRTVRSTVENNICGHITVKNVAHVFRCPRCRRSFEVKEGPVLR
jgi:DNA-directed RNA polymerase subunit RPC12/RpoP